MDQCPKCGSKKIRGPFYNRGCGGRCHPDRLEYVCPCGYRIDIPTLDAKKEATDGKG